MLDSTGNNKETTCVTRRENRSWIAKSAKNPFKLTSERRQNKLEYSSALTSLSPKTLLDEKFSNIACVTRRERRKLASERRQNQMEYSQPFTLARHHRHAAKVSKKVSKFEFW